MLKRGILNPAINSVISRVRHTNMLVIADRGFPYWPEIETVDISLTDDIPTVLQVLRCVREVSNFGAVFMAAEFRSVNTPEVVKQFEDGLSGLQLTLEPHTDFKKRVPRAIALIRTGDTTQYANLILESA